MGIANDAYNCQLSYGKVVTSHGFQYLSYISNSPSWIGQKLNWNVTQALGEPYTSALSYTDSWCLVPFSSNYPGQYNHEVGRSESVFWLEKETVACLSPLDVIPWRRERGIERGTQQDNSNTKQAITDIIPVGGMLCRVKEASHCNVYWANRHSFRRKWMASVAYCKEKTRFGRRQGS